MTKNPNDLMKFLFEKKVLNDSPLFYSGKELAIILIEDKDSRFYKGKINYKNIENVRHSIIKTLKTQLKTDGCIDSLKYELMIALKNQIQKNNADYIQIIEQFNYEFDKNYHKNIS